MAIKNITIFTSPAYRGLGKNKKNTIQISKFQLVLYTNPLIRAGQ